MQLPHMHLSPGEPLQATSPLTVLVTVPVLVLSRLTGSVPTSEPFGPQSRLVAPNAGTGDSPFASHSAPACTPIEQVPPLTPSFGISPAGEVAKQRGHGSGIVKATYAF